MAVALRVANLKKRVAQANHFISWPRSEFPTSWSWQVPLPLPPYLTCAYLPYSSADPLALFFTIDNG